MVDIYVCGAGLSVPDHLTLETVRALERSTAIYSILPERFGELLPLSVRDRFVSLWSLYQAGRLRRDVYQEQATKVLEAAKTEPPVAYLTQGNPMFFDSVVQTLVADGHKRGMKVVVCPSVSAIDTILVDLGHDVAPGLQVYDASAIIEHSIQLRADIPGLLFQVGVFGTSYVTAGLTPNNAAHEPLRRYLQQFYPPAHDLIFVRSATSNVGSAVLQRCKLVDLGAEGFTPTPGSSLYIPPAHPLSYESAFRKRMLDAQHLTRLYRPTESTTIPGHN